MKTSDYDNFYSIDTLPTVIENLAYGLNKQLTHINGITSSYDTIELDVELAAYVEMALRLVFERHLKRLENRLKKQLKASKPSTNNVG